MKRLNIISMCAVVIATGFTISSCVKELGKEVAFEDLDFGNKAQVQVYNGVISSTRNYVYVDATPVTGAALAYNASFPSTPAYFAITPGYRNFLIRDTLTTSTQPQMSFAENLAAGKYYTIFTYDTVTSPKQKIVTNNIVFPDDTTSRLRFANLIYSPNAVPAFDVFSKKRNAVVFSNVQRTEVTEFIPYASALTDTFYLRIAGTNTNLQNFNPSPAPGTYVDMLIPLTLTQKRNYTLVLRGSYRNITTTSAGVRNFSVFANN